MNKVFQTGYISKDIVLRDSKNGCGEQFVTFTLSVYRSPRTSDEKNALFFPVVAFGKTAAWCYKNCKKGSRVAIAGAINNREYTDAEGIKRFVTEINADVIELQDKNTKNEQVRVREITPGAYERSAPDHSERELS
jgi:single-strand DNA-binding protein